MGGRECADEDGQRGEAIRRLMDLPELAPSVTTYINRLNAIDSIKAVDLHIEEVAGEDMTIDVMVDIFNRVNSSGTTLTKGDLALAKMCAEWPAARQEMSRRLAKWEAAGFQFRLDWFLRTSTPSLLERPSFPP